MPRLCKTAPNARHGGRVVDTQGDSFFIAFASGRAAVLAAVEAQCSLAEHDWPEGAAVSVRMGIHTGQAAATEDRYHGLAVHRAARIAAAGHGGQVLVSQTTHNLLEDEEQELPGFDLRDLGEQRLKDLDRPVRLFQVTAPGLRTDFPPLRAEAPAPAAAPRYRRRPTILVGALAGVIAAAIAVPVLVLGGGGPSRVNVGDAEGNAVAVLDSTSGAVRDIVEAPAPPTAMAAGLGYVWTVSADSSAVIVVDTNTNTVRQTIPVESGPSGIAIGGGWVWVTNSLAGNVSQISPETLAIVQTIKVGNGPTGIAAGKGYVWVANTSDHTVTKLRATDGKKLETVPAGLDPGAVAFGEGAVWVASKLASRLVKLSSSSGEILDRIPVGAGPAGVTVGAGSVWVAHSLSGIVSRIDPRTREVRTVEVGSSADAIAFAGGDVWVASGLAGTVSRIDARSRRVTRIDVGDHATVLAAGNGALYVGLRPSGAPHVGGTLRVALPGAEPTGIDTAHAYTPSAWRILALTNDGLVGWKRVSGQAGVEPVPDLAVSLPSVSEDRRTYTFQLRSGIRYSDGRPVKASDVRYSLERVYKLKPTPERAAVDFYRAIVGADRCSDRPSRCDLSRGIVTDDRAGTVAFHLSEPDPEFLFRLALPFAYVLPTGTPLQEAVEQPLPATGPYRVASVARDRSLRLVRNPRFREWSRAAQPPGIPDEIVVDLGGSAAQRARLVAKGKADLTSAVGAPLPVPPVFRPQLHVQPTPATHYLVFDVTRPPFDDVRARRAVNYALDRAKVVRLVGGSDAARPSCQVLPPNFPGYSGYCPYTLDPSAGSGWTAPDVAKAKRLVAASGTAGARVVLWWPRFVGERPGRYFETLLDSLGYRARLRLFSGAADAYFRPVTRPGASWQIAWWPWGADYAAASNFITLASCSHPLNLGDFCDRAIDARIQRALRLQERDPAAASESWAAIDRELADQAPFVFLYSLYSADFVSKRVGNYQYHPLWGTLYGQLWIR
jgi:YVTN family beta-propeller protein